jgi:hypothetical protein
MAQMRKSAAKPAAKKAAPSTVQQIAKRFNITAREARDIATAVGSLAKGVQVDANRKTGTLFTGYGVRNLGTQVKEAGRAAVTGKKGTDSTQIKTGARGFTGVTRSYSRDKSKNAPGRTAANEINAYLKTEKKLKKQGK